MCTPNRLNLLGMTASDYEWQPDILGKDFQQLVIPLGADPISEGGEGDIFATLVRYAPADQPTPTSRPAVLFVHGMTDYFFPTPCGTVVSSARIQCVRTGPSQVWSFPSQ